MRNVYYGGGMRASEMASCDGMSTFVMRRLAPRRIKHSLRIGYPNPLTGPRQDRTFCLADGPACGVRTRRFGEHRCALVGPSGSGGPGLEVWTWPPGDRPALEVCSAGR